MEDELFCAMNINDAEKLNLPQTKRYLLPIMSHGMKIKTKRIKNWETASFHMPVSKCVNCDHTMNAATNATSGEQPRPGGYAICFQCGCIMKFDADLKLRGLTEDEEHAIQKDKRFQAIEWARRYTLKLGE